MSNFDIFFLVLAHFNEKDKKMIVKINATGNTNALLKFFFFEIINIINKLINKNIKL